MTSLLAPEIVPHTTFHTTAVAEPFCVRLAAVTPDDPVADGDVVTVYDQVVIGGRAIVRSASGEGFWHVAVDRPASGPVPTAHFETHRTVRFSFPRR